MVVGCQPYAPATFSLEAESTPGPWFGQKKMLLKNPVTPQGIDPATVQLVAQRLNHYATPGPAIQDNMEINEELDRSQMTIRCMITNTTNT